MTNGAMDTFPAGARGDAQTVTGLSVRDCIDAAVVRLHAAGISSARLDAELLLARAVGVDRVALHVRPTTTVSAESLRRFEDLLARRLAREPLAYIFGCKEFWSLELDVGSAVLIPRPETELAVEAVLRVLRTRARARPAICDVGTGSGCIAIAMAHEVRDAAVVAIDKSPAALAVAAANARKLAVSERIEFVESDLLAGVRGRRFDVIVSNPPYVAASELETLEPELRWEPAAALNGGEGGLEVIERFVPAAAAHIEPGGALIVEIGASQAAAAEAMAKSAGFSEIRIEPDYSGLPRVMTAIAP